MTLTTEQCMMLGKNQSLLVRDSWTVVGARGSGVY